LSTLHRLLQPMTGGQGRHFVLNSQIRVVTTRSVW